MTRASSSRHRSLHLEQLEGRQLLAVVFDTHFGGEGKASINFGTGAQAFDLAVAPDRKIVVAGNYSNGNHASPALARFDSSGMPDVTFGDNGIVKFDQTEDSVTDLAVQRDGKIVVSASGVGATANDYDFTLIRFNRDGTLDTTFGGTGRVTVSLGSLNEGVNAIALQSDGKIVAVGYTSVGASADFAAIRLNANGSLDTTFSQDGKVTTAVGPGDDFANAVALQPDGKIVLTGSLTANGRGFVPVVRYNANGSLDSSFGDGGIFVTRGGGISASINAVQLQSDGKIVLGGLQVATATNVEFLAVRVLASGKLDPSFSGDGVATAGYSSGEDDPADLAIQADGKILMAGASMIGSQAYGTFIRFTSAGVLDKSFDDDGRRHVSLTGNPILVSLAILPDGRFAALNTGKNGSLDTFDVSVFSETKPVITSFIVPDRATFNTRVHLSGLASDPNQTSATLSFAWTITGARGFKVTLKGRNVSFVASQKGKLTVKLVVTDQEGLTASLTDKTLVS